MKAMSSCSAVEHIIKRVSRTRGMFNPFGKGFETWNVWQFWYFVPSTRKLLPNSQHSFYNISTRHKTAICFQRKKIFWIRSCMITYVEWRHLKSPKWSTHSITGTWG